MNVVSIKDRIETDYHNFSRMVNPDKIFEEMKRNKFKLSEPFEKYYKYAFKDIKEKIKFIFTNLLIDNEDKKLQFINILTVTGHDELVLNLFPDYIDLVDLTKCDPTNGYIETFSFAHPNIVDKLVNQKNVDSLSAGNYTMSKSPRGYCILINNYCTIGTFKEMQRFRNIFFQLHFNVIMLKNLTAFEMHKTLKAVASANEIKNHEALIVMLLGKEESKYNVVGFDGSSIDMSTLIHIFDNESCPFLINKPKIFFFNCGKNEDGYENLKNINSVVTDTSAKIISNPMPRMMDTFVLYSDTAVLTSVSNRGTLFGESFIQSLVEKCYYKDLERIITKTNFLLNKLSNKRESLQIFQTMTGELYFHPDIPAKKILKHICEEHKYGLRNTKRLKYT